MGRSSFHGIPPPGPGGFGIRPQNVQPLASSILNTFGNSVKYCFE